MWLLALSACDRTLPAGDAARPDIVLVSIDSLRADHLGSYGYARSTSPFLDHLAASGLRFRHAYAASPWTLPSHMTMLTGLGPLEHQVVEDDLALAPNVPMIQEALSAQGWATAGFVSTIYVAGSYGFARGFSRYEDHGIAERDNLEHPVRVDQIASEALAWAKENAAGKPVFLFLHLYDVHYPYLPPSPWDERFDRAGTVQEARYRTYKYYQKHPPSAEKLEHQVAQYDESIAWVDDQLGKLHAAWGRPATWIVTADHGEELGERGSWGHAHTLHEEALAIPLIVNGPGVAPAVRDERVGTADLAPTIAGIAGVPWEGVDLRGPVPERPLLAETSRFDTSRLSWREGPYRLDLDLGGKRRALYDVLSDPGEEVDLAAAELETVARLERRLLEALGHDWVLDEGSAVTTGALIRDGVLVDSRLDTPGRFALYPPDAQIYREGGLPLRGVAEAPSDGPLRYEGPRRAVPTSLSDATREQLEALGYAQ